MALPLRRKRLLGLLAVLAAAAILGPLGINAASGEPAADEPVQATAAAPTAEHGKLSVCGTNLCDESGDPVQLRGMSTHGLQWYSQCVNDASLDALAYDWGADVVRLSMYIQEDGYETDPEGFTAQMHQLIEEVTARGQYVIVDWHMLSPGDPHYNLERAETFFAEIAREHGDKENIFYEVANEPSGVSWSRIKSYHEAIIPVIRQYDPDGIVLLGTPDWSSLGISGGSNEQEIIDDQVNASNIMYTFHFYAASHREDYLNALERAAREIPIFVTEFGTQNYAGEGANDFAMTQRYLDLMEREGISWVNWNYSDDQRSGAVFEPGTCPGGPFAGTGNLKEAGEWIRDRIREGGGSTDPTDPPTDPTDPPTDPTDPPGDLSCAATASVNGWDGGATVTVTVSNTGTRTADWWTVQWDWGSTDVTVTSVWSAQHATSGTTETAEPVSWNQTVEPGGSVSFGFNVSGALSSMPQIDCTAS